MKTWTLRFRAIDKDRFEEVRSGLKKIETRAATIKYQPMQEGDTIVFVCGEDQFSKQIKKRWHFKNVEEMVKEIPIKNIMPALSTIEEVKKRYASYPDYEEKIAEFGLIALELE